MTSKGEITKQKIVAEATKLVQQKGFKATSMSDLVAAAGVQKGCLYFHFSGKDELLLAILEQAKADFLLLIDGALQGATPGARLASFFQGTLALQQGNGFACGCIFGKVAQEMGDQEPRVAAFIQGLFAEWAEKIQVVVQAAQLSGEITCGLDAEVLGRHIIMALEGGIMLSTLERRARPLEECISSLRALLGMKG
jgi:TetR/AcrR family transcriptional repressor of nem operon